MKKPTIKDEIDNMLNNLEKGKKKASELEELKQDVKVLNDILKETNEHQMMVKYRDLWKKSDYYKKYESFNLKVKESQEYMDLEGAKHDLKKYKLYHAK